MLLTIVVAALTAVSLAHTVPPTYKTFVDTFDNYTTNAVTGTLGLNAIGFDGDLYYGAFNPNSGQVDNTGLIAASGNIVANAFVTGDLLALSDLTLNPFGTISIYGTRTKYFTLKEFFYGCLQQTQSGVVAHIPVGCDLEVFGYDIWGTRIGSVAFNFAPTNTLLDPMSRAVLPDEFVFLQNVTIVVSDATIATTLTVLEVDNVAHINYY